MNSAMSQSSAGSLWVIDTECGSFRDQVGVMAHALALDLGEIRFHADFAIADTDTDFGFMTVRALAALKLVKPSKTGTVRPADLADLELSL